MPREDKFNRYQDAGTEFIEAVRDRAVDFLREVSKVGESTQRQAQGTVEDLVDGGRRGSEQILDVIRSEITRQLSQLGLATKKDIEALESRLGGGVRKAAPVKKAAPAKKAAPVKKAAPAKKAAPVKKAAPDNDADGAKKAGGAKKAATKKAPAPG
ncbi:MAG: hypothetical protein ACYC1D_03380 [Acidimicrobiales bacterium]